MLRRNLGTASGITLVPLSVILSEGKSCKKRKESKGKGMNQRKFALSSPNIKQRPINGRKPQVEGAEPHCCRACQLTVTFSTQSSKKARPVSLSLTKVHSSMKRMKIWVLVSWE